MYRKKLIQSLIAASLGVSGSAFAVEVTSTEDVSSGYVRQVTVDNPETGEAENKLVFGQSNVIWTPRNWNRILSAYGLELSADQVANLPRGFARVVEEVNENGETELVVVFNGSDATAWTPENMNRILNAYGVSLDLDDMEGVPGKFARSVDELDENGEPARSAEFGNQGVVFNSETYNAILQAYKPMQSQEGIASAN